MEAAEAPIAAPARLRTDRRSSVGSLESTFSLFPFMLFSSIVAQPLRIGVIDHCAAHRPRCTCFTYPILCDVPQDRKLSAIRGQKVAGERLVKMAALGRVK